jgi:DNA replication and repair protein RecF
MTLRRLTAENVRCLSEVRLEPAGSNLIFGENASGKTSLLEAIFILGRGRSFRTATRDALVRDGEDGLTVSGLVSAGSREIPVGIGIAKQRPPRIRVDGKDESSVAALAQWVPVQVIDPQIHQLVDEGPGVRRRFLDWGVFHVEPRFLEAWRRYHRTVRQRNAALKTSKIGELDSWDRELAKTGEELSGYRRQYVKLLEKHLVQLGVQLLDEEPKIIYQQGWPEGKSLGQALRESRERDLKFGITHMGSHRSDLEILMDARQARGRVSRGQQKLLAATLVLSQVTHLIRDDGVEVILLLDDLAAELDRQRLRRMQDVISGLRVQLFMTALHRAAVKSWEFDGMFHVEQGEVRSVL